MDTEGHFESPVDINLSNAVPIELPLLKWHHHELPPKKMKLTNTGHTRNNLIIDFADNTPVLCSYFEREMASGAPFSL